MRPFFICFLASVAFIWLSSRLSSWREVELTTTRLGTISISTRWLKLSLLWFWIDRCRISNRIPNVGVFQMALLRWRLQGLHVHQWHVCNESQQLVLIFTNGGKTSLDFQVRISFVDNGKLGTYHTFIDISQPSRVTIFQINCYELSENKKSLLFLVLKQQVYFLPIACLKTFIIAR